MVLEKLCIRLGMKLMPLLNVIFQVFTKNAQHSFLGNNFAKEVQSYSQWWRVAWEIPRPLPYLTEHGIEDQQCGRLSRS